MCTARLFSQGVDLFALEFYVDRVVPSTILGIGKVEALGYLMVKTASLCVPSFDTYRSVTDRQKDTSTAGRMDLPYM